MDYPSIRNRRELFDYLQEQMDASYRQVLGTGRLEYESTYLKTYLLERDEEAFGEHGDMVEWLAAALTIPAWRHRAALAPTVHVTDEDGFYTIEWEGEKTVRVYLDTVSDAGGRFWIAYSLSDATSLDRTWDSVASGSAAIDRTWFWPSFLQAAQAMGEFRGIGLHYDYRRFERAFGIEEPNDYLKMQLSGGELTQQIVEFLSGHHEIGPRTIIAKIKMRFRQDADSEDAFALEDVYYNGKFTSRGPSFAAHRALVLKLLDRYARVVREFEDRHVIRFDPVDRGGVRVAGDPVFFVLEDYRIEDVQAFCDVLLSGHKPFRLWGIARAIPGQTEAQEADVTDLHSGSRLFLEVYPDVIAMYAYEGACGNTIIRLYTNLQHTLGRRVSLEANDGERIL